MAERKGKVLFNKLPIDTDTHARTHTHQRKLSKENPNFEVK